MQWIPTAFRFLLNRLIAWRKSITRWAFVFALFSAWSSPFSFARGDDFDQFEDTNSVLRIEDLTPEARVAVSNLAGLLAASSSGDKAAAATVEDNVAAILALLQSYKYRFASTAAPGFSTYPIFSGTVELSKWLSWNLNEQTVGADSTRSKSFLHEIQRALYGQAGEPSSSQAVLPVLWRMESALTNNQSSVDMGWTNRLDALLQIRSQLDGTAGYGPSLSYWLDQNRDLGNILYSLQSYFASVVHSHAEGPYNSTLVDVFDSALASVWESQAYNASSTDSALRVVDAEAISALMQLNSALSGISSDLSDLSSLVGSGFGSTSSVSNQLEDLLASVSSIEDYTRQIHYDDFEYYNTDRSVQRDFRFLHQQLGVEQPSRTNNIYYLLSRLFDDSPAVSVVAATGAVIEAELNSAKQSAESSVASSSNTVARIADEEEPDWEHDRYTGDNPLDTGDSIFDLPLQQVRALLPTLPESQHKEIVLFRGDFPLMGGVSSQSRSGRSVRLDVSYPLLDYDAVSSGMVSLRTIMEWVWQLCSAVLCVSMLFRFYTSLATDKLNMEADASMGV